MHFICISCVCLFALLVCFRCTEASADQPKLLTDQKAFSLGGTEHSDHKRHMMLFLPLILFKVSRFPTAGLQGNVFICLMLMSISFWSQNTLRVHPHAPGSSLSCVSPLCFSYKQGFLGRETFVISDLAADVTLTALCLVCCTFHLFLPACL